MNNDVTVRFTTLYKVRKNLPPEELRMVIFAGIDPEEILWCMGNRQGSLGWIGNFCQTYKTYKNREDYFSPGGKVFNNMPMRYFEEFN